MPNNSFKEVFPDEPVIAIDEMSEDILIILDMDVGYGYDETPAADYNGDGLVNTSDWITLVQFILNN